MKLIFSAIIFALVFSISSFAQSSTSKRKTVGKISGVIFDESNAVVLDAKIVVAGKNFKREIKTNESGYYEIWLPRGKYELRVPEQKGFYSSARKLFFIMPNKTITHNLVLKGIPYDVFHPSPKDLPINFNPIIP